MSDNIKECRTCTWWIDQGMLRGECHRYAPRPSNGPGPRTVDWPLTALDHGCGDHSGYPR